MGIASVIVVSVLHAIAGRRKPRTGWINPGLPPSAIMRNFRRVVEFPADSMTRNHDEPVFDGPDSLSKVAASGGSRTSALQPLRMRVGTLMIPIAGDRTKIGRTGSSKGRRGRWFGGGTCLSSIGHKPRRPAGPAGRMEGSSAWALAKLTAQTTVPGRRVSSRISAAPAYDFVPSAGPDSIRQMLHRLDKIDLAEGIEHLRRGGVWADRWTSPDLLGQPVRLHCPASRHPLVQPAG